MSDVSRFMSAANAMLDGDKSELFRRTQWLFTEMDEQVERLRATSANLKLASAGRDKAATMQVNSELAMIATQILNIAVCINKEFEKG